MSTPQAHEKPLTLAALQPGYLPWLGYFDQLRRADVFIHYDDVQYDKHGWRNRNRIKSAKGEPHWLTVPVLHGGRDWPQVREVEIDARAPWGRKHAGTLRQFYAAAPHFAEYFPALEAFLLRDWRRLMDLDLALVDLLAGFLGIETRTAFSSQLGIPGSGSLRLVEICRHLGATSYLTGDAAKDYLDTAGFASQGIEVVWQSYRHPEYPQLHGAFVPYLSIVDLLFNCGPDSLRILKQGQPE